MSKATRRDFTRNYAPEPTNGAKRPKIAPALCAGRPQPATRPRSSDERRFTKTLLFQLGRGVPLRDPKFSCADRHEMADALLDWAYHSNQTLPGTAMASVVATNRQLV